MDLEFDPIPNMTTTTEASTSIWEEKNSQQMRRTIYYIMHGIVGLLVVLFNGFVLLAYLKRKKLRRSISTVMLNMFVFCFLHGFIVGIIYPLQRVYRYTMSEEACVITTLVMDYCDNYILILLPVLAIERLILIKYPNIDPKKVKTWSICSMICVCLITVCYAWLPLIPQLEVPRGNFVTSENKQRQNEINHFYRVYTCQYKINKKNYLEPIFRLATGTICVIVVIGVYLWMFVMLKMRLSLYSNLAHSKKQQLRKAALYVLAVALTFIFSFMPYGISWQIRQYCSVNTSDKQSSICNGVTLELRFVFSIVAHFGNFLAPFMFTVLSPHLRKSLVAFVRSRPEPEGSVEDVEFETKTNNLDDNCAPYTIS